VGLPDLGWELTAALGDVRAAARDAVGGIGDPGAVVVNPAVGGGELHYRLHDQCIRYSCCNLYRHCAGSRMQSSGRKPTRTRSRVRSC